MTGYTGSTLEDVYKVAKDMQPGDKAKEFFMREIADPEELASVMIRLMDGREDIMFSYSKDGPHIRVYCSERKATIA